MDIPNLTLSSQNQLNLDIQWDNEVFNTDAESETVKQIQFIENPKITSGLQPIQKKQNDKQFQQLMSINQKGSSKLNKGFCSGIVNQSRKSRNNLTNYQ